jgi:hypothetical protein
MASMLYTQQQALQIVGLEQSTFVYWMRTIPRVKQLKGRGCHFAQPDLLALSVLNTATQVLGCNISWLSPKVETIFDLMASAPLTEISDQAVVLGDEPTRLERLPFMIRSPVHCVVVALGPIVNRVTSPIEELLPLERLMFPDR